MMIKEEIQKTDGLKNKMNRKKNDQNTGTDSI